ncbi:MAG: pathogenesis-related transcriptional factor and ERF protein [uncultured bacterium]|nr:MAG: pathogenesis-related transcriptional factor and ERF protein [uncultured bacterium]
MTSTTKHRRLGLTAEQAKEVLHYDPQTGQLTWKISVGSIKKGALVTSLCSQGYIRVCIHGHRYGAHRVIWLMATGEWPRHDIDHLSGVRTDNRLANLRDVTRQQNLQNLRTGRGSSKLIGVARYKDRFRAEIRIAGKKHHLGCFDTAEEAHGAYVDAKRKYHPTNTL